MKRWNVEWGWEISLAGPAGGALLVGLRMVHFGRTGPFRMYSPVAARNILRELGLMLFLSGAGAKAGTQLLKVIQEQGGGLFLAGAAIMLTAFAVTVTVTRLICDMNLLSTLRLTAGVMTNASSLAPAVKQSRTDVPAVTCASIYPAVLIFKILAAQILVQVLRVL